MGIGRSLGLILLTLPRWFAAPVIVASVLVGAGVSDGLNGLSLTVACLVVLAVMAFGHTMNSVLDYHWTGLDVADNATAGSRPKPYTSGQQLGGTIIPVLAAAFWGTAAIGTMCLWVLVHPGLPAQAVIAFLCGMGVTVAYSWGKLHWCPEIALGLGFATLPALMGAASASDPGWVRAVLASLPVFLVFGFAAEIWDQWYDADVNWVKGLRNLGALAWRWDALPMFLATALTVTILVHVSLVALEALSRTGLMSLWFIVAPMSIGAGLFGYDWSRRRRPALSHLWRDKRAVLVGLGAISAYTLGIAVVEVVL